MSEMVRVSRVAIKTEVIPRSGESVGTVYKVTVGRLNGLEKDRLINALSKVSASSCEEVERPEGACGTGISFEMYSTLKEIAKPTWVCNDAILEFRICEFCQRRLNLVYIDDFSEGSPMTPWFETDVEDDDEYEESEEPEHVTEEFTDVGIEVLDLEFAGGNPNCNYWAKIRLFDLAPAEVEKVKRVYERDPEDLPKNTKCGERLEPGFELEVRPSKEHSTLKEVTVVLYCKNYEPFKEIGAYSRNIDIILDYCEGAICPVIEVHRVHSEIKVLEPEQRFGYAEPSHEEDFNEDDGTAKHEFRSDTPFILHKVAIKTLETFRTHSGIYVCKIHIGRMSETERQQLESFARGISAYRRTPYRFSMSMVDGGKTIPGTLEPLHTYETHAWMLARSPQVVDVCDLKFTYVADKDMILAEVVNRSASSYVHGINWFNVQMEDQAEDVAKPTPIPEIDKIEFNEPATIIFWKDGTKSVVQARDGEPYDAEKGIAMAIAKKALGNERDYYHTFIHWLKRYEKKGGKR